MMEILEQRELEEDGEVLLVIGLRQRHEVLMS